MIAYDWFVCLTILPLLTMIPAHEAAHCLNRDAEQTLDDLMAVLHKYHLMGDCGNHSMCCVPGRTVGKYMTDAVVPTIHTDGIQLNDNRTRWNAACHISCTGTSCADMCVHHIVNTLLERYVGHLSSAVPTTRDDTFARWDAAWYTQCNGTSCAET